MKKNIRRHPVQIIEEACQNWIAENEPVRKQVAYLKEAEIRCFFFALKGKDRMSLQNEVDLFYKEILKERRIQPFALDDYLVLFRQESHSTGNDDLILVDEELERDQRVCRTFVWNRTEDINDFLNRTPFGVLPAFSNSTAALEVFLRDVEPDLAPWIELAANANFDNMSVADWLSAITNSAASGSEELAS